MSIRLGYLDVERGAKRVVTAWQGFTDFVIRDNVLEVALGLILAQAFSKIVTSLVTDIILPPIGLLPFLNRNLSQKFAVLRGGPLYASEGYNTLQQAIDDGAVTLAYGRFLDSIFSFIIIGLTLYGLALSYQAVSHDSIIKQSKKCQYCRKDCAEKAARCPMCTSWLDGREDKETTAIPAPAPL